MPVCMVSNHAAVFAFEISSTTDGCGQVTLRGGSSPPRSIRKRYLHGLEIEEVNFAPGVLDHARLLQRMRDRGDAGATDPQHLGKIFLGEQQGVAASQIPCPQQPAAEPAFDGVVSHTCGRLLSLGKQRLLVAKQHRQGVPSFERGRVGQKVFLFDAEGVFRRRNAGRRA